MARRPGTRTATAVSQGYLDGQRPRVVRTPRPDPRAVEVARNRAAHDMFGTVTNRVHVEYGATAQRIGRLLESERKRTARLLPNVPIHLIQAGSGEGQVPLRKLPRTVQKLKPTLTKQEVAEVIKRLSALGAVRLPVPTGVDPMRARMDRKSLRGR